MASFGEIEKARKLLGLGEAASLKDIKTAYRNLARRYHPDKAGENESEQEMMREINRAYELLEEYCKKYKYSFTKKAFARAYPQEAYIEWWFENWRM